MHRAIILPFLLAPLGAAEIEVADLRLGVGAGPLPTKQAGVYTHVPTPSYPFVENGAFRESYDNSPGLSVVLGGTVGTLSPTGFLWGTEFRHISGSLTLKSEQDDVVVMSADDIRTFSGDNSIPAIQYSQNGIAMTAGGGYAINPQWHLELMGIAGIDWITFEALANLRGTLHTQQGKGLGTSYGGRLGIYWTSESSWQLGIEGEWTNTHGTVETSYLDVTSKTNFNNSGFSARASVGYRF